MNVIDTFDTICAPATIPGTGAVSMIRVSGTDALKIVDKVVSFRKGTALESKGGRVKFGCIYEVNGNSSAMTVDAGKDECSDGVSLREERGEMVDEVLVSIFKAPHSYTGEDSCEISCHASSYIVSRILDLLVASGCRLAGPGEFTQRAFINGKMDLTQAEAVADVIASGTAAAHRVAIKQLKGGFSSELAALRLKLLEMASLLELELDFSEEDVEFADRQRLTSLLDTTISKVTTLADSFRLGNAIKNGVPVAIVGATNAGKSTLLNAILGEQRAIVSDIAGTTRDTIEECFNIDGVLFRFVDTAGIRESSSDVIENIGIERSFEAVKKADIVIYVIDATAPDYDSLTKILETMDFKNQKLIFAVNKSDLSSENGSKTGPDGDNKNVCIHNTIVSLLEVKGYYNSIMQKGSDERKFIVDISAKSSQGLDQLLNTLSDMEKSSISQASSSSVLISNERHHQALRSAATSLLAVRSGLQIGVPTDLLAEDLREALSTLGSITGEITHTEVLNNIFANFCIGK